MKNKILVVDDSKSTLQVVCAILEKDGSEPLKAHSAKEALSLFEKNRDIDVILADLKMPGTDGLKLYQMINAQDKDIPFVIMTAHGTVESAVEAMKEGVTNYLIKPLNYDELSIVLTKAIREKRMTKELTELRREVREKDYFREIIGSHPKMNEIFEIIRTAAPTDVPVLIKGETGTGKELMAKALHSLSIRHDRSMICINSAALADSLLEAELFGHVKGAFTGAIANKKGRLESAHGGTLFLDEIGHMSLNLQAKLLRFLQEGTFEPVGGIEERNVDVRVITATNRDLTKEISDGRFLSDLLFRIEVISITLPPLRERGDDIFLLVNHFIKRFREAYGKNVEGISQEAMDALIHYPWPGNIRELENCIARALILSKDRLIGLSDLPDKITISKNVLPITPDKTFKLSLPEKGISIKEVECELIKQTLDQFNGNKSEVANILGISRKTLYEKMVRYGLEV